MSAASFARFYDSLKRQLSALGRFFRRARTRARTSRLLHAKKFRTDAQYITLAHSPLHRSFLALSFVCPIPLVLAEKSNNKLRLLFHKSFAHELRTDIKESFRKSIFGYFESNDLINWKEQISRFFYPMEFAFPLSLGRIVARLGVLRPDRRWRRACARPFHLSSAAREMEHLATLRTFSNPIVE